MAERLAIYKKLQDKDDTLLASPETIAYRVPPTIDERRAIAQILREKLGMTDEDLRTPRRVKLRRPSLNNRPLDLLPVDEFLLIRQMVAATMRHGSNVIWPADEWNTAQKEMIARMAWLSPKVEIFCTGARSLITPSTWI